MIKEKTNKGAETKGTIVNAAVALFSERGYDGASVKDITDRAAVPKSLFYHYFNSKSELLEDLINNYSLRLKEEEKTEMKRIPGKEAMEKAIRRLIDQANSDKDMLKIIIQESLKEEWILKKLIEKINILEKDFNDAFQDQIKGKGTKVDFNIFSFYFRFLPIAHFIFSRDRFADYYGVSTKDLEKQFFGILNRNPYL